MVGEWSGALNIRYDRRDHNYGVFNNVHHAYGLATTPYFAYCADDDRVDVARLLEATQILVDDPKVGAAYFPMLLANAATGKSEGWFPASARKLRWPKGQFAAALSAILDLHLFPELAVFRRELLASVPARSNISYWPFLLLVTILKDWDVVLGDPARSYYTFYIEHPLGRRSGDQAGRLQSKTGWDDFRGGLEFMLGVARDARPFDLHDLTVARAKIDKFIAVRQRSAFDMLLQDGAYTAAYHLARRLSLGDSRIFSPQLLNQLRVAGAVEQAYLARHGETDRRRACLVGGFPIDFARLGAASGHSWLRPPEPGEADLPRIAWNESAAQADVYAEPFLVMFSL
jgi:hypothetical protein